MQIREFNVVQTAKVAASIYAIFGVAVGAFRLERIGGIEFHTDG